MARDPNEWATFAALPVAEWMMDPEVVGKAISGLGKTAGLGLIPKARELNVKLPPQLDDPNVELTGELIVEVLRDVCWHFFPRLAPAGELH